MASSWAPGGQGDREVIIAWMERELCRSGCLEKCTHVCQENSTCRRKPGSESLPSCPSCPHMSSHGCPLAKGCRRLLESPTVGQREWGVGLFQGREWGRQRIWTLWGSGWGWGIECFLIVLTWFYFLYLKVWFIGVYLDVYGSDSTFSLTAVHLSQCCLLQSPSLPTDSPIHICDILISCVHVGLFLDFSSAPLGYVYIFMCQ